MSLFSLRLSTLGLGSNPGSELGRYNILLGGGRGGRDWSIFRCRELGWDGVAGWGSGAGVEGGRLESGVAAGRAVLPACSPLPATVTTCRVVGSIIAIPFLSLR